MSLYTLSKSDRVSSMNVPAGLRVEANSDIMMLSQLCDVPNEEIRNRLATGHFAFVAYLNNEPVGFGWMATNNARIGELNHEFYLPKGNRYLWNFRTIEAHRGKGVYPALLHHMLLNSDNTAIRFWIIHAPENVASLNGIRKVGFKYAGKLYIDTYNTTTIELNDVASDLQDELEYMNITLSEKPASSCWNCSSPFLKKRSSSCCCAEANAECVGKRALSTI